MQVLKTKIGLFVENADNLLKWAKAEKKTNPEAEDVADEIILTAYEKLVDAGADELLLASGFEDIVNRKKQ